MTRLPRAGSRGRLGVLGGTFDPVHFGHLDAAAAARAALELDELLFIPSHDPPHRSVDPHATSFQRFAMVALAIDGLAGCRASDEELRRPGNSYTSDTLRALHAAGWSPLQIFFILGADALADIASWHEFPAVLDAANFAVIARPGTSIDDALARTPALRSRVRPADTAAGDAGQTGIVPIEAATRNVSSTMIRARLAAGGSIGDLVPPPVARHIAAHHLYVVSGFSRTQGAEDGLHGSNQDKTGR
jgi:nicotinate-nucleotide adenylyltransferase